MSIERDIKELDKLLASRGWALVVAAFQDDLVKAALGMASSATMSNDALHFRRGAIYACSRASLVPQTLRDQLAAELALTRRPATAGQHGVTNVRDE